MAWTEASFDAGAGPDEADGDRPWLVDGAPAPQRYGDAAPAFDFACVVTYGVDGLVAEYPGIAVRVA